MNIPQVAHLVACKVSGLPGCHNWSRYAPDGRYLWLDVTRLVTIQEL